MKQITYEVLEGVKLENKLHAQRLEQANKNSSDQLKVENLKLQQMIQELLSKQK